MCSVHSGGRYCGRRAAVLYGAGELFACRLCYGLAYASQHETPMHRSISRAQKVRLQLGGSASLVDRFPKKPRRMHWRTFLRVLLRAQAIDDGSAALALQWLNRSSRTGFAPNDSNAARFLGRRETGKRLAKIVAKGAGRCAVTWLRLTAEVELNRITALRQGQLGAANQALIIKARLHGLL
jgi:hypothetical protein